MATRHRWGQEYGPAAHRAQDCANGCGVTRVRFAGSAGRSTEYSQNDGSWVYSAPNCEPRSVLAEATADATPAVDPLHLSPRKA